MHFNSLRVIRTHNCFNFLSRTLSVRDNNQTMGPAAVQISTKIKLDTSSNFKSQPEISRSVMPYSMAFPLVALAKRLTLSAANFQPQRVTIEISTPFLSLRWFKAGAPTIPQSQTSLELCHIAHFYLGKKSHVKTIDLRIMQSLLRHLNLR